MKIERDRIIEQCKKKDARAEFQLYQKYSKALYNCAYRLVNDKELAADLLQEAFVKIFRHMDRFNYTSAFYTWAKTITVNHCISHQKKRGIDYEFKEDMAVLNTLEPVSEMPHEIDPKHIREALLSLSDGYREIFSLYLLEGYDHAEISEILSISVSTSKTQYMRAKNKVKKSLIKMGYGRAI